MTAVTALPLGSAEFAVEAFRESGGVVEYYKLKVGDGDSATRHRLAAQAVPEAIDRAATIAEHPYSLNRHHVSEPDRAVGTQIDLRAFMGDLFDWDSRRIEVVPSAREVGPNNGYAHAFADPPYGLRASSAVINDWFSTINRQLFGGLDDDLEIFRWSTDWSTFFDAGHEWWGAFLWTVTRPGAPVIVAIAASTSD